MKKIVSLYVMCLCALCAWADNKLYINDFSLDPGETVDVSIMLDNEVTTFASFQADMYLPAGLELVEQYNEEDDEYFTFALTTRARSRMAIGSSVQGDGAVRLMLSQTLGSTALQTIKETSGALVTFKLKASESAAGALKIDLKNIVFSTANSEQYTFEDTQTNVTVGSSAPVSNLMITTNSINLFAGTSQTLSVYPNMENITWESSDSSIATVSADGVVTGKKFGNTTITCTLNGVTSIPFSVNVMLIGDINRDGFVTIADVTELVNIILGR
jgi:hypothetical protein